MRSDRLGLHEDPMIHRNERDEVEDLVALVERHGLAPHQSRQPYVARASSSPLCWMT
ncbi:hypothetical protein [Microbacterium karelineae]|uniref:hypothetical protein n=1 Tax=Microbacterium karelineae TaxID=2654283 RepID=UPI001E422637|nr:hypothetical protein [Microbacterium karelineae]